MYICWTLVFSKILDRQISSFGFLSGDSLFCFHLPFLGTTAQLDCMIERLCFIWNVSLNVLFRKHLYYMHETAVKMDFEKDYGDKELALTPSSAGLHHKIMISMQGFFLRPIFWILKVIFVKFITFLWKIRFCNERLNPITQLK